MEQRQLTRYGSLLQTKLTPPRLHARLVTRPALLAKLDKGLACKLTLLSAPAGFGKTTLVKQWICDLRARLSDLQGADGDAVKPQSLIPKPPVAWLSLDVGDSDPVRFWHYVIAACQKLEPNLGANALAQLHGAQSPPFEVMLTTLLNELAQLPEQIVLLMEDYHLITAPQIHEQVTFLIDHLPAQLHLVFTTRHDPPLPLARWRARQELNELGVADLRFSVAEAETFLLQALGYSLPRALIHQLDARTEGWVTGLHLVALTLQTRCKPDAIEQFVDTFSGSHRHILEYLATEVLSAQPPLVQAFLLQTTFLGRLTGALCDALLDRQDSAHVLEQLAQANLFLVPLADGGRPTGTVDTFTSATWYRYHALFAEAIQYEAKRRLGADCLRTLAQKASLWYEAQGAFTEAIESALAAHQFERAAALIEQTIAPRLIQNEFHTLRRWIEQLPALVLRQRPLLCWSDAIAILFTSDRYDPATQLLLESPLTMAEQYWRHTGNQAKLGEVLAFRALGAWCQCNLAQTFGYAHESLALLPAENRQWRGISLLFVGLEEFWAGKLSVAQQTVCQALELSNAAGNTYGTLDALLLLGEIYSEQGALRQAAQAFQQALTLLDQTPLDREQAQTRWGRALLNLSVINIAWYQMETAEQKATEALAISQQYPAEISLGRCPLVLAQVKQARGQQIQAYELLQRVLAQPVPPRWPFFLAEAQIYQARLALAMDDLTTAQRWLAINPPIGVEVPHIVQEHAALVHARLLVARGEAETALRLLALWQADAETGGRTRSVIANQILQALAYVQQEQLAQAKETLLQALTLAHPEGEQWLFLEAGEQMGALLRVLLLEIKTGPLVSYVRNLLLAFVQQQPRPTAASSAAIALFLEPLSAQEERVLRLLAAGLSNPEIAREQIVSVNTVKTQVQSIFRKLSVNNRQEAREAASRLNLH